MKSNNILDILSTHFLICNEKIANKGEDSGFESFNQVAGVVGVFDGCGGLGSKMCSNISNKTEAYVASRTVCAAVRDWFHSCCISGCEWSVGKLKLNIEEYLYICDSNAANGGIKLKGSMVRPFPSTIAMITFSTSGNKLVTNHFWAGDSRTYVLDNLGLSQISVDDIKGEDAMSNLTRDGALTNVLSSDKNFIIHNCTFSPNLPCIMFAASDGCFGYVSSPMEFEFLILSTLVNASNVMEWKENLNKEISTRSGDDQTIGIAAFGFDNFSIMKKYFTSRYLETKKIISLFETSNDEKKQILWEEYKLGYYRHSAI